VTRVYLDPGAASIENGGPDPAALRSLGHLVEGGHEVVLVGGEQPEETSGAQVAGELRALTNRTVRAVPPRPDVPSWYLTDDVGHCHGLTARVRSVLIGAAPPPGSIHRCDSVARDVQAAVMEILAAEAVLVEDPSGT
jgi:hypothetical protein